MAGMLPELGSVWRRNCLGGMEVVVCHVAPNESNGQLMVAWDEHSDRGDGRCGSTPLEVFVTTYVWVRNANPMTRACSIEDVIEDPLKHVGDRGEAQKCKDYEHLRSVHWPVVRNAFLAQHPACAACGGTEHLEVHHVVPFHVAPLLELDGTNLLTLCEAPGRCCHLWVGHAGNFRLINEDAPADAALLLGRVQRAKTRGEVAP
jgi:5-methylcytosine-specific restriction protein A